MQTILAEARLGAECSASSPIVFPGVVFSHATVSAGYIHSYYAVASIRSAAIQHIHQNF